MNIDKDKKDLSSEQKLGRYDKVLNITKIIGMIIFTFVHYITIFFIIKYKYVAYVYIGITLLAILHLMLFCKIKEYKFTWLVLIILFPILGALMYFLGGNNSFSKRQKYKLNYIEEENINQISNIDYVVIKELAFLNSLSKYKIYKNQGIDFFNTGEDFFYDLINEMKNAKKSILIDIYILSKGVLLNKILEVLKEKVKEGVIVELIYDDFGSLLKIPKNIRNDIKSSGIKLYAYKKNNFNISSYINHREHKKIFLIDGKIAYTGGINIADEYINKKELHRVWKDGGVKIYGNVAITYLLMYLKTREQITNKKVDYTRYIQDEMIEYKEGFVLAYSDGPDEDNNSVENIYLNVINNSKKYLYIVTPYFIPSKKIIESIKKAADRGVDIRILLPHIADKKIVEHANRSYYNELLEKDVKIYEYKKGFIHTKYLISDNISLVGTANLDYKSLYFNFECMNLSYNTGIENKIKSEFENDIKDAIKIELENKKTQGLFEKCKECIAHFLTPLL